MRHKNSVKKVIKEFMAVIGLGTYFFVVGMLMFGANGLAYIDPSVMTYVIQAVSGVVIAIGAAIGIYWRKAKKKLNNKFDIDKNKEVKKNATKKTASAKATTKKTSTTTKATASKKATTSAKTTAKKASTSTKATANKSTAKKSTTSTKTSTKKTSDVKTTTKKTTASAKNTAKKASTSKTKKSTTKSTSKAKEKSTVLEYYDLPYRYNQTIVKILAQTPTTLFVYWDISDVDRMNFIEKYGNDFFNKTKPILLIHNKTKNNYFEVEINDFANSWYLRMQEPDCEYDIELARRDITNPSQYVYVSSSNQLVSPNDHVLFDETDFTNIKFKNVKSGAISKEDFGSIRLMTSIGSIYNKKHKVYSFYNNLYKDEVLESNKMFSNPSSSNPTSNVF